MGTPFKTIELTAEQQRESLQSFNKAMDADKKEKIIQSISIEIKCLREALKDQLGLNHEELEAWLIANGYKEQ